MSGRSSRTKKTIRSVDPQLLEIDKWPPIDIDALGSGERDRYVRLVAGLKTYVATRSCKRGCEVAGVARSTLINVFDRCVTPCAEGGIAGWKGLIQHKRLKSNKYTPSGVASARAGQFKHFLLKYPAIEEGLRRYILQRKIRGEIPEVAPSKLAIHRRFKSLCRREGVAEDQYPFNTKSEGRRSVERFVKQVVIDEPTRGIRARYGKDAAHHLRVGTGIYAPTLAARPLDVAHLDGHKIDVVGTIVIEGPAGPQWVAISRLWILILIDSFSRTVLGFSIGVGKEVTAQDVQRVFWHCEHPWTKPVLSIKDLKFANGAGIPNGTIEGLKHCVPSVVMLDNAKAQYAELVLGVARKRLGFRMSYIPFSSWECNAIVERFFESLEGFGIHRLVSTTGSSPVDPKRPKSPAQKAVAHKLTFQELAEFLMVLVCNYNARPHESLGHQAPLDVLSNHQASSDFLACVLPPASAFNPSFGRTSLCLTVKGSMSTGRRPYVHFCYGTYTSPEFANMWHLLGKDVLFHVDEDDIRTARLYTLDGSLVGDVQVKERGWRGSPHSRAIRVLVGQLKHTKELQVTNNIDHVQALGRHLAAKALAKATRAPHQVSRDATTLARVVQATALEPRVERREKRSLLNPSSFPSMSRRPINWKLG